MKDGDVGANGDVVGAGRHLVFRSGDRRWAEEEIGAAGRDAVAGVVTEERVVVASSPVAPEILIPDAVPTAVLSNEEVAL